MKSAGVKRVLAAAFVAGAAALSTGAGHASTSSGVVAAAHFTFLPPVIVITAGSDLTFANADTAAHSVTARDLSFDSGYVPAAASAPVEGVSSLAANAAGYEFVCAYHTNMQGLLIVV